MNHLTPDEACEHMAKGKDHRVLDVHGDKWKLLIAEGAPLYFDKVEMKWMYASSFDSYGPFTPYVRKTKRELRERAETAEARVRELEDGGAVDERVQDLEYEHYWYLYKQMLEAWGNTTIGNIGLCEVYAFMSSRNAHKPYKRKIEELETDLAAVTAERDALASRVAWLEALVPENEETRIHTTPFMPIDGLPEEKA